MAQILKGPNPAKSGVDFQRLIVPHPLTGRNHAKLNSVEVNILLGEEGMSSYLPAYLMVVLPLLSACSTAPSLSRVDISGKSNVEVVGAGASKIKIQTKKDSEAVMTSYSETGASVLVHFEKDRLSEMWIVGRTGDTKTVLKDEDGDGLPDMRMTLQVFPDGGERAIKIERLSWTSKEEEPNHQPQQQRP